MPTVITHSVVAVAAAKVLGPEEVPKRFWLVSIFCSVIPDVDVLAFSFGIPYGHFFGHRGFFHSTFFGLVLGVRLVSFFPLLRSHFRDGGGSTSFISQSYQQVMASLTPSPIGAWALPYYLPLMPLDTFFPADQSWFLPLLLRDSLVNGGL